MDSSELTATLYFAAAIRAGADSSLTRLLPLRLLNEPLSPHESFSQRILFALQALGMIEPELSLSNAGDWLEAKDWVAMGPRTLAWRICWTPNECRHRADLADALLEDIEPSDEVLTVLLDVWRDLALAEVVQYAAWALAKSGYNPNWAEEAAPCLQGALERFSIVHVQSLVQMSLRWMASTHQRGSVPSSRLGIVFADSLDYLPQRACEENWKFREVPRPAELPVSAITILFAHQLTRLHDEYATQTPSTAALLAAMSRARSIN